MPYYATPYHAYYATPYHAILCHTIPCHTMSYHKCGLPTLHSTTNHAEPSCEKISHPYNKLVVLMLKFAVKTRFKTRGDKTRWWSPVGNRPSRAQIYVGWSLFWELPHKLSLWRNSHKLSLWGISHKLSSWWSSHKLSLCCSSCKLTLLESFFNLRLCSPNNILQGLGMYEPIGHDNGLSL